VPQRNLLSPDILDELRKYRDEGLVYTPDMNPVKPDPGMFQHKVGPLQKDNLENTKLSPSEENDYQNWLRFYKNKDVDPKTNELFPDVRYDMRGYFKANTPDNSKGAKVIGSGPPQFNEAHGPDTFKQHGHPTFSAESKYSRGPQDGGKWIPNSDTLIPPPVSSHGLSPEINVPGGLERKNPLGALKKATSIGPMTADNTSSQPFPRVMGPEGPKDLGDFIGRVEDLSNLSGLNPTDTGNIEGPSEAVTRFVTKGIPDKTARIASTEKYLQSARKFPTVAPAAEAFAKKYPRIAAHSLINPEVYKDTNAYAAMQPYEPGVTEGLIDKYHVPINIHYSKYGIRSSPEQGLRSTFHEGTHVAQKLGLGEAANDLYQNMDQLYGYKWNPAEIGAVRSEFRNTNPPQSGLNKFLDPTGLRDTQENIAKSLD